MRFRWKDYADHDRVKIMTLTAPEFLRRFLHIVPSRFIRIRHAGLFGNHDRHARLAHCRALLDITPEPQAVPERAPDTDRTLGLRCPVCGQGRLHVTAVLAPLRPAWRPLPVPDPP